MKRTGGTFQPWSVCQRCRREYPLGMLVMQKGLRVCTLSCFDDTSIEYRPLIISQILSDGATEGQPQTPEITWNPEELKF